LATNGCCEQVNGAKDTASYRSSYRKRRRKYADIIMLSNVITERHYLACRRP